ncbi:MAG: hypothetical protein Q4C54_00035 [Clostridia bacterium]|nr:hypothetical protein [Clostridia bacterium]
MKRFGLKHIRLLLAAFGLMLVLCSLIWSGGTRQTLVNLGAVADPMTAPAAQGQRVVQPLQMKMDYMTSLKILGADFSGADSVELQMQLLRGEEVLAEKTAVFDTDERQLNIPFSFGNLINNEGNLSLVLTVTGEGSASYCGAVRECPAALVDGQLQPCGIGLEVSGRNKAFSYAALYLGLMLVLTALVPVGLKGKERA